MPHGKRCRWDDGEVHNVRFSLDLLNHLDYLHPSSEGPGDDGRGVLAGPHHLVTIPDVPVRTSPLMDEHLRPVTAGRRRPARTVGINPVIEFTDR
jgi:hypothetical protein